MLAFSLCFRSIPPGFMSNGLLGTEARRQNGRTCSLVAIGISRRLFPLFHDHFGPMEKVVTIVA